MWAIHNQTAFAAERTLLRDDAGREVWVVAVKATYKVDAAGNADPVGEQPPVRRAPRFAEVDGGTLMLEDADLVLPKPATDVLVAGHAYAPRGKPVEQLVATVAVGPIRKSLVVVGDRTWVGRDRPALSAAKPFVRMPLTYERSFGGADPLADPPATDARNPVGRGFVTDPRHAHGRPAPNFELGQARISRITDRPPPVGFGPVAPSWSPRIELAGTHDDAWLADRHPLPPRDQKPAFRCAAPADQQAVLKGGEPVSLENLTPSGRWTFQLPRLALGFETHFEDGSERHGAVLSTVELRPDDQEVTMTFLTHLPCHGREQRLVGTIVTEKTIVPLGTPMRGPAR